MENEKGLVDKDNMITHKVKDPTRKDHYFYLTQKQAREYFALLADPTKKEFVIADTEKFIYITIPRNKFYLIWLDDESDIEDILMRSGLTESGKEEVREIISNRKTSRQKITNGVIKSVIEKVKEKYFKT